MSVLSNDLSLFDEKHIASVLNMLSGKVNDEFMKLCYEENFDNDSIVLSFEHTHSNLPSGSIAYVDDESEVELDDAFEDVHLARVKNLFDGMPLKADFIRGKLSGTDDDFIFIKMLKVDNCPRVTAYLDTGLYTYHSLENLQKVCDHVVMYMDQNSNILDEIILAHGSFLLAHTTNKAGAYTVPYQIGPIKGYAHLMYDEREKKESQSKPFYRIVSSNAAHGTVELPPKLQKKRKYFSCIFTTETQNLYIAYDSYNRAQNSSRLLKASPDSMSKIISANHVHDSFVGATLVRFIGSIISTILRRILQNGSFYIHPVFNGMSPVAVLKYLDKVAIARASPHKPYMLLGKSETMALKFLVAFGIDGAKLESIAKDFTTVVAQQRQ